jgi:hypothetical protein
LEYFLSLLAPADRDGFLEFAMRGRPGVPTVPKRTDSVPQPERVVYLEMVSRPRGVHFSDPEMNAAWQAVFRRDD